MSESLKQSDIREGYKEVQLGPKPVKVPSEWEIRKLDELTNNSGNYGANVSAVEYDPEMPRYIRITDIGDDGFLKDDDRKSISRDDAEGYYLFAGDLLFARTGATAGKSYLCREDNPDAAYAGYLIRFELDESQVDIDFLALYVQSKLYHDWVDRITRHGAQQNINASEYRNLDVLYPPLPEQRRIADILSTVDEQIQQTDEIIEKTKELKRGLAQDLYGDDASDDQFPDRAPELPEGWSLRPISDLCDIGGGKTPSKSNDDYWGGTVLWASPKDFDGPLLDDTEDKITEFGVNDTSLKTYSPGNIAVVVRSGVLQHTLPVAKLISKSTVNQDVKVLQPNTDAINPEYFFQMLRTQSNRIRQRCMKTGTTVESIETSFLKKYMLRVPPQGKQEEIAGVLSNLDRKVQLEQNHLVTLQELKRGLMQDLLTGKVRVNTD